MKTIKWKRLGSGDISASVGNISMECWALYGNKFRAFVSIGAPIPKMSRYGKYRKSMAKAQCDAIRLARELLEDYQIAIEREVKLFEQCV